MSIKQITKVEIMYFSDSKETAARISWIDHKGRPGSTLGFQGKTGFSEHMNALGWRATKEGVPTTRHYF
jgi:hypothetical protein